MKLYQHTTDGGAEYLSINPEGADFYKGVIARTDGQELEIYTDACKQLGITLNICL